jgi:hypothetical protein
MKWAEVIRVRSAPSSAKMLDATLDNLASQLKMGTENDAIRILRREQFDSDFCIVLFNSGNKIGSEGSTLGLTLVAALKEAGLVNHTVWREIGR